jgi:hypothetical protein
MSAAASNGRCKQRRCKGNSSLWVEYHHIFRRSDTLTFSGVGGASWFRELVRRDFDKVLFGINDRFSGSVVARYRQELTVASKQNSLFKAKSRRIRGFFYSTTESRSLLPSRHGNPLRSMLALICGSDPGRRCEDMKRWIVSAVAALMALLLLPHPRVIAPVRAPARSAPRSRRWI